MAKCLPSTHQYGRSSATSNVWNTPFGTCFRDTKTSTITYALANAYRKTIGNNITTSHIGNGFAFCSCSKAFSLFTASCQITFPFSSSIGVLKGGLLSLSRMRYLSHLPKR